MIDKQIIFAGDGHGGIVALKSLQKIFSSISIVSEDSDIAVLLRESDNIITSIEESDIDLVVCAGYHSIISKKVLRSKTIINTHPSLLPKYRGLHGLVWAMLNFEKEVGFTIHLMNEYIDDGDILEQYKLTYDGQTSQEIMEKFDRYVENSLGRDVKDYLEKKIIPKKQNREEATWVARRNIDDCIIDFNRSNQYLSMLFKALVRPYPLPMIQVNNKLYEVDGYKLINRQYEMHIGRVVNIEDEIVYIKTFDGLLLIDNLIDFDSKEKLKAKQILKLGQRL